MSDTKIKENRIRVNVLRASTDLQARLANSERPGLDAMHLMELGLVMEKMLKSGGLGNQFTPSSAVPAMSEALSEDTQKNPAPPESPQTAAQTGVGLADAFEFSADTFAPFRS